MSDLILHLLSVARGFEDDGRYSQARAFRAAAMAEEIRATAEHLKMGGGLEQAAGDAASEFRSAGGQPELADLLEEIARSAPQRPPSASARLYVCRWCGYSMRDEAPSACPSCGAGRLVFSEVPGVYFLLPVPISDLLDSLAATPGECALVCAGLDGQQSTRGEWPVVAILSHMLGADERLTQSAVESLEQDDPPPRPLVPATEVRAGEGLGLGELLDRFAEARAALLLRVKDLTPDQWARSRVHPLWGRMSVHQYLSYVARHEHQHLSDLRQAAAQAKAPTP